MDVHFIFPVIAEVVTAEFVSAEFVCFVKLVQPVIEVWID